MDNFFIKDGYQVNEISKNKAISYENKLNSAEHFQNKVYEYAKKIIRQQSFENVLDIGCGIGFKLYKIIHPIKKKLTIVGIDGSKINIMRCREYPFGKWYIDDVEKPELILNKKFDLIIASDIIEHLFNPDHLIQYVKKFSHENTLILISTPERDILRGKNSFGPPTGHHIREWSKKEFAKYLKSRGFEILKHKLINATQLTGLRALISKMRLDFIISFCGIKKCRYRSCQLVLLKLL